MPKPRKRASLDTGACLDINRILRGDLKSGTYSQPVDDGPDHVPPREAVITLHLNSGLLSWIRLQYPDLDHTIGLTKVARHFGGHQWYFLCPMTGDRASALWMPRRQNVFASQKYWKSQFSSPCDRADLGIERIEARLVYSEADNTTSKPKWMRWRTFHRLCQRLDAYEEVLNDQIIRVVARLEAMTRR